MKGLLHIFVIISGAADGFRITRTKKCRTPEKLETLKSYDTVNFVRRVEMPGIYSRGFNDEVVPLTSSYAAYNVINAPKTFLGL